MNGVALINSESPLSLKDSKSPSPVPSIAETFEYGRSSKSHVVITVILSSALIALFALGIWFISFKGRQHERAENVRNSVSAQPSSESVSTHPSAPPPKVNVRGGDGSVPDQPSAAPIVKGRGDGRPVRTHPLVPPPTEKGRGRDGSVPAQPSAAPIVNGRGDDRSVPTSPTPPMVNERRDDEPHNASSNPAPKKIAQSASIQLASRHTPTATSVSEIRKPNRRPSRVAEFGLIAFAYEDLRKATDNFSQANFLGEGGFAKVYKGSLSNNRKVAVKLLKNENSKAEREFRNEVDIISRVKHINIVTLIGYCITDSRRMIVYEFVENRSLHDHLRGGKDLQFMDWPIRMKIAQGAAKGLAYLHEECGDQNIIHRDVKPANILLDSSFVAKVADFGISKLCPNSFESYIATYVIGSVGFIDPFYYESKELSFKSDVYSFGVVLLELISGETHLPKVQELKSKIHRALKHRNFDTIADPKLENYNLDEMTLMVTCVEACLRKDPKDRPPMSQVTRVLEKVTSADELKMKTRSRRG